MAGTEFRLRYPYDDQPLVALLTPGPFNETYFEHAYLARYLGLPLVEGADLTVRGEHVFLKTVEGTVKAIGESRAQLQKTMATYNSITEMTATAPGTAGASTSARRACRAAGPICASRS